MSYKLRLQISILLMILCGCDVKAVQLPEFCKITLPSKQLIAYTEAEISKCDYARFDENSKLMTNLQSLRIEDPSLSKIPAAVVNFKNLANLAIHRTRIRNLGHDLTALANLEYLSLVENQIRYLPAEIFRLPKLESLTVLETDLRKIHQSSLLESSIVELTLFERKIVLLPSDLCASRIRRINVFVQDNIKYGQTLAEYSPRIKAKFEKMLPRCIIKPYQAP